MSVGEEDDIDLDNLYRRADATRALHKKLGEERNIKQVLAWAKDRVKHYDLTGDADMQIIKDVEKLLYEKGMFIL